MNKLLFLLIMLFIVILFSAGLLFNSKDKVQDCGFTSILMSKGPIDYESDISLSCFGKNFISNCKRSKILIETPYRGNLSYELINDQSCVVKVTYPDSKDLSEKSLNQYGSGYLICPLDMEILNDKVKNWTNKSLGAWPGETTYAIQYILSVYANDPNSECTGTLYPLANFMTVMSGQNSPKLLNVLDYHYLYEYQFKVNDKPISIFSTKDGKWYFNFLGHLNSSKSSKEDIAKDAVSFFNEKHVFSGNKFELGFIEMSKSLYRVQIKNGQAIDYLYITPDGKYFFFRPIDLTQTYAGPKYHTNYRTGKG